MKLGYKKINWLLIVIIITLSLGGGCETKENEMIMACGVEDPIRNLPWLSDLKNNINSNSTISTAEVSLYIQNNVNFFYISQSIESAYDLPSGFIYNCEGEILYTCGGNQPTDTCHDFFTSAILVKSLWRK